MTSRSVGRGRWGSWPTPATPWTCSPCPTVARPPPGSGTGAINLFVHLTPEDLPDQDLAGHLAGSTGAVDIERLGAATTGLLDDWCTRHTAAGGKVIVRPVLDLADPRAVDQHDPPAWMREQVVESNAFCVFPGCRRDSRSCDLDHITEYVPLHEGGPPGQTRAANLAPLCRTHHRVKTFTSWTYKRLDDGTHVWTAPTGHHYDVDPAPRHPPHRPARRRT